MNDDLDMKDKNENVNNENQTVESEIINSTVEVADIQDADIKEIKFDEAPEVTPVAENINQAEEATAEAETQEAKKEPNFTMLDVDDKKALKKHLKEAEKREKAKKKAAKKAKGSKMGKGAIVAACMAGVVLGASVGGAVSMTYVRDDIMNDVYTAMEEQDANYSTSNMINNEDTQPETVTTSSMSNVIEEVRPSVVAIETTVTQQSIYGTMEGQAAGTGFVFDVDDEKAYIVTNNHVIEGANTVNIYFDGASGPVQASLVGTEPSSDLAVITVELSDLAEVGITDVQPVTFADSDDVRVGDPVIAIGNALGEGISATSGMISVTDKDIDIDGKELSVFQTDAAINPGNSGGPLINENGEVIGINTAKLMGSSTESVEGVGYAVTSNEVMSVIDDIMADSEKAFMGITGTSITPDLAEAYSLPQMGVIVVSVIDGGSASEAGILPGDIITSYDGQVVKDMETLQEMIQDTDIGDTVEVKIIRDGGVQTLDLTLQQRQETSFS